MDLLKIKFTESSGEPYYFSEYVYDKGLLEMNRKPFEVKINRVSDNKYMGKWNYLIILNNFKNKTWRILTDKEIEKHEAINKQYRSH